MSRQVISSGHISSTATSISINDALVDYRVRCDRSTIRLLTISEGRGLIVSKRIGSSL